MHDCIVWEEGVLPIKGYVAPEVRGTHIQLSSRLQSPDPTLPAVLKIVSKQRSYALRAFHALRVIADYELLEDMPEEDAHQAVANAQRIFAML
ncbi:hypothetical protein J2W33_001699 [Variovorax boronicumulans]|nr:hypothetical protein [Variovorax boronicumulans]